MIFTKSDLAQLEINCRGTDMVGTHQYLEVIRSYGECLREIKSMKVSNEAQGDVIRDHRDKLTEARAEIERIRSACHHEWIGQKTGVICYRCGLIKIESADREPTTHCHNCGWVQVAE